MILKELLLEENIIKIRKEDEEPFVVNELGTRSRFFIDIKEASTNPIILQKIGRDIIIHPDVNLYKFDKIGCVAVGGIPIATTLSLALSIPLIIVRSKKHERGTQSSIIGNCKGRNILFIEDVTVTGNAAIKGIKAIREAGGICHTCIVIVDREEGAIKNCFDEDIELIPLLKKSDFGITEN